MMEIKEYAFSKDGYNSLINEWLN